MTDKTEALRLAYALEMHDDPRLYHEADVLMCEASAELMRLDAEVKRMTAALSDATISLNTIAMRAGIDENMEDMSQVRGYARSRCHVARAALSGTAPAPKLICKMCGADRFAEPCRGNGVRCGITGDAA